LGYGNCILALNTPFNREVLKNGLYGLLFEKSVDDLREKMKYLLENPDRVDSMKKKAPERIQEAYTWESIINKYEILFKDLLNLC